VIVELPLEKASQDRNSKQRERRQLNFQENLSKVISFTLHLMICTKVWIPIYHSSWTSKGQKYQQKINKVN